jgi:hypothetical protein
MSFRYRAFGLEIQSDLELPELDAGEGEGEADLTIELVRREVGEEAGVRSRIDPGEVYTFPPHIGRCWVRTGRQIEIEPLPNVDSGVIRLFLLGTALGVILHQRGYLVLHASTVMVGSGAISFIGHSGAGKSTLAAAFDRVGYPVVADDIAAIRLDTPVPQVLRGFRQIRLWPDSASAVGHDPLQLPRLHSGVEKVWLRSVPVELPERLDLRAILVLDRIAETVSPETDISRLDPQDSIRELLRHTFTARMLENGAEAIPHLRQCAALLRSVPIFRLAPAAGLENLPATVDTVVARLEPESPLP